MKRGRQFKNLACPLPVAVADQVIGIHEQTGIPVAPILRKFFAAYWETFLAENPQWKALAELGPVPKPAEMNEGEIAETV
jgi:hypothetical protein